ncbi:MAG: AI-2E family transporter [Actinobacteria bacterium]|nr:AI-2E family transporter [Actinomycetota bacterium]MBV8958487.1 AI-2E family transporter [Actinomycetota bacterium]MBV9253475.1 AI-2E family transporter [Actinomycetota bacterium]MBV9664605.1 AI-2E family transporter [Actinomycetota bacterium]
MGPSLPIERLRFTPRSAVLAVVLFGAAFAALRIVSDSQRVIGWILAASALAGLLHPVCERLRRFMPNGLAVVSVMLLAIGATGLVAWGAVGGIVRETHVLQEAAPKRAAELERSQRFGRVARQFKLVERTKQLVKEAPQKLRGGTPAEAIRSATTRGLAFLATAVLTLFLLLHGPNIARAGAQQIADPRRRARWQRIALQAYRRAFGYARGTILMGVAVGVLAFVAGRIAGVPGAAPLALWAGLWDAVPLIGAFVGALPIIGLAAADDPNKALVLGIVFLAYELFESFVLERRLEQRTLRVGPFLTIVGGFAGLELYGIGGALMALLVITFVMSVLDEVTRPEPEPA